MGRKHGMLKSILTLGGLAAAGAAIYRNRELIRDFISEASGTYTPEETSDYNIEFTHSEPTVTPPAGKEEPVIVIDHSDDAGEAE